MPRSKIIESEAGSPRRKHLFWRRILIIFAVLLVIRLCLPYVVLHFVNKKLASLDGYYGHAEDINLALIRGAYVIRQVYVNKVDDDGDTTEFFKAQKVDLSVEWGALFQGKLVGEVVFKEPVLKYTLHETVGKKAEKDSVNWIELVKDMMPMKINRFEVRNGQIHYVDKTSNPKVDSYMTNVTAIGKNLTNEPEPGVELPASIQMSAKVYDGSLKINVKLDPLNKKPTFDLNCELTKTNLTHFNDFFKAYGKFDMESGNMSIYSEFAARNGNFRGYIKPIMTNVKVLDLSSEEGSPLQIAWEGVVGILSKVFQNQKEEQIGAKINLEGQFKDPEVDILGAILSLLQNAFIKALEPSIDNTINYYKMNESSRGKIDEFIKGTGDVKMRDTSPKTEKEKRKEEREKRKKERLRKRDQRNND